MVGGGVCLSGGRVVSIAEGKKGEGLRAAA